MKIYYEVPDRDNEDLTMLQNLLHKCFKFQVMWCLRSLENRINAENGSIFIDQVPETNIRFEGFSNQLEDEMRQLIAEMKYEIV